MAAAVPFLLSAFGASTTATLFTTVAFTVTGISDKINKAASKVFGEDLVKIGNLFATGYAIYNGGFDIGGSDAAAVTVDPNAMNVPTGAEAGNLFEAHMAGMGESPASIMPISEGGNVFENLGMTDDATMYDMGRETLTGDAWDAMGADNSQTLNLLNGEASTGVGVDAKASAQPSSKPGADMYEDVTVQGATAPGATAQSATGAKATGANAAGSNAAAQFVPNATQQGRAFQDYMAKQGVNPTSGGSNIFTRLFTNKDGSVNGRMVGAALQGVGAVAQGVSQSNEANKARRWQQQMYNARPTGIVRQ